MDCFAALAMTMYLIDHSVPYSRPPSPDTRLFGIDLRLAVGVAHGYDVAGREQSPGGALQVFGFQTGDLELIVQKLAVAPERGVGIDVIASSPTITHVMFSGV